MSDHGNDRVQIFDSTGEYIHSFDGIPQPLGIGSSIGDAVYIISGASKLIYVCSIDKRSCSAKPITAASHPYDCYFSSTISDMDGNRILIYGYGY